MLTNFPKIECPFVRERISKKRYLVTDEVNPGFEWVFDDPDTIAVEKLDGTNVKLRIEDGRLVELQNRMNVLDPLQVMKGNAHIIEGVLNGLASGYITDDGIYAGEVIGPKLQKNPLNVPNHIWYPFDKAVKHLKYRSFHEHDRTLENFSNWFKDHLKSRLMAKKLKNIERAPFAEGVIFYNLKREANDQIYMAKLRRDMFGWYYDTE